MRRIRHWTPRFIFNRMLVMFHERSHPDQPWLTADAASMLDSMLKPTDVGLEFGSGRSTPWFAARIARLTSVEDNEQWFNRVDNMLREQKVNNVDYVLAPREVDEADGDQSEYVRVLDKFDSASLDFVLVDGYYRDHCVLKSLDKIRSGGLLVIDNVNWYLPSASKSPGSRSLSDGPNGPIWCKIQEALAGWRKIWTCSGVSDTVIYIKPERLAVAA